MLPLICQGYFKETSIPHPTNKERSPFFKSQCKIKTMTPSITIIGCGFLGTHFLNAYHTAFNTIITTSKSSDKPTQNTEHHHLDIYTPTSIKLSITDICLICIPFSRQLSTPMQYAHGIKKLIQTIPFQQYQTIIFTSSTSIYALQNDIVTEESDLNNTARAQALHTAEQHILTHLNNTYILRLSGICGHNRNSQKKLQKKEINNANHPINLIHTDDITAFMHQLCTAQSSNKTTDIINVTCSDHPTKEAYYTHICNQQHLPLPKFIASNTPYKKVSNKKLVSYYTPIYPSPLDFKVSQ
jgi:nucleoside-diphosphate-sugar epimerase